MRHYATRVLLGYLAVRVMVITIVVVTAYMLAQ